MYMTQTSDIVPIAVPERLSRLHDAPEKLYQKGNSLHGLLQRPCVAVVGSRKVTPYGTMVTRRLAGEMAEQGIVIISGLAYGVDAIAHEAALEAGGTTLAVMAGGLDTVYPSAHTGLARRIIETGGCLVSEYPEGTPAQRRNFVARNRIVAGLSQAVLITEAAEGSGSIHTADFAAQLNLTTLAVPGNITSPTSVGTNELLKHSTILVTGLDDILQALSILPPKRSADGRIRRKGGNTYEQTILDLIEKGTTSGDELLRQSELTVADYSHHLTMLEITGKVRSLGNNHWTAS